MIFFSKEMCNCILYISMINQYQILIWMSVYIYFFIVCWFDLGIFRFVSLGFYVPFDNFSYGMVTIIGEVIQNFP